MESTATVAVRPPARRQAVTPPARSICAISQPPKMSPLGLVSAGMATVRIAGSPGGGASVSVTCGSSRPIARSRARFLVPAGALLDVEEQMHRTLQQRAPAPRARGRRSRGCARRARRSGSPCGRAARHRSSPRCAPSRPCAPASSRSRPWSPYGTSSCVCRKICSRTSLGGEQPVGQVGQFVVGIEMRPFRHRRAERVGQPVEPVAGRRRGP